MLDAANTYSCSLLQILQSEQEYEKAKKADISGYTSFCEALPPYDVIHVLSRYFHLIGKVITRHGGYISDYIGDGIMALFGIDNPAEAALRAVKAGVEMLATVEKLNPYLETMYKKSFQIRLGVH